MDEAGGDVDLSVDLAPGYKTELRLRNPIMTAAGSAGSGRELASSHDIYRLGAFVTRTVSLRPQRGRASPRFVEAPAGILRSTGRPNAGVSAVLRQDAPLWARWSVPVIVSIAASDPGEAARLAARLDGQDGVSGLEIDLTTDGSPIDTHGATEVAATVRDATMASALPILVRIAPGTGDPRPLVDAIERAGAQALTVSGAIPGMSIDTDRRGNRLSSVSGMLSGPAIRPLATWNVSRIAGLTTMPVVAAGGATSGEDAVAFIMAGATAVQIGSASFREPGAAWRILDEFETWCRAEGLSNIEDIRGLARARD